ncbi:hypothetical protein GH714_023249 [Hevea brasiliensis]|uniref:Cardiolipin synthase N-terminal domain-containing protein n=1 Tax=Hevea brasiliensis TaxID=3981 RepID=A0A6A6KWC7_HEVBR|nr:hypothetical protein GH714_023249 [Hevea brasiliensis]
MSQPHGTFWATDAAFAVALSLVETDDGSELLAPTCKTSSFPFQKKGLLQVCHSVLDSKDSEKEPILESETNDEKEGRDWTTSILLFVLWGALMYYVFNLAPNQTPSTDEYFLRKLLNLKGDDGFEMNQVLVSLCSKSKIPVWPFLVLSCFGGAYGLLPYFVLWRPPPPPVEESELGKWPLNFLESKLTAGIHIMSLDFTLLSAFAPFWVYNDMTARKWFDKGSWLLPISLVPLLGPALYLVLRPSLSEMPVSLGSTSSEQK